MLERQYLLTLGGMFLQIIGRFWCVNQELLPKTTHTPYIYNRCIVLLFNVFWRKLKAQSYLLDYEILNMGYTCRSNAFLARHLEHR